MELVRECINDGILAEFLTERLPEVTTLMESIFNEDYYMKCVKSDGYDEGMAEGEAKGKREERIAMAKEFLKAGTPISVVSSVTGFKASYIQSLI